MIKDAMKEATATCWRGVKVENERLVKESTTTATTTTSEEPTTPTCINRVTAE